MPDNSQLDPICRLLRERLPALRSKYDVESLSLFGSHVRGNARATSDLDVLVTFRRIPGLLRFIELENELSDLTGKKVDLVLKDALKPAIGQRILAEAIAL
jgi:predicted nucleotidyltransferase